MLSIFTSSQHYHAIVEMETSKGRAGSPLRADACNHVPHSAKDGAHGVARPTSAHEFMPCTFDGTV
ncbi:MAG: hypothetical protein ABI651_10785 [Verrucomicrobiota bacterium]